MADPGFDDGYPDTAPVGSFPAGASWVGALDMAGNVREWVADGYGAHSNVTAVDPRGRASGDSHIPSGGAWYDIPDDVRSANRGSTSRSTLTPSSVSAVPAAHRHRVVDLRDSAWLGSAR